MSGMSAAFARHLAGLDPALSALPEAAAFAASRGWRLHDARWTPGVGSRLAWFAGTPGPELQATFVTVAGTGWSHGNHRDDRGLPGVGLASDPDAVGRKLAPLTPEGATCFIVPVRYRPGSRCVLRYEVIGARQPLTLYAKAYPPPVFTRLSAIAEALNGHDVVPPAVRMWPEAGVVISGAAPGRTGSAILGDSALTPALRARTARRAGSSLAQFHSLPSVPAGTYSAADEIAGILALLPAAEYVAPEVGRRARAVTDRLAASLPPRRDPVLTHGGFRLGQAMVDGTGSVTLLDLDGVTRSDGERDLGNALAHLAWHGIRHPAQRPVVDVAERALVHGYRRAGGRVDARRLRWWRVAALVKLALRRYTRLESVAWPMVPLVVDAAEELLADRDGQEGRPREYPGVDLAAATAVLRQTVAQRYRSDARSIQVVAAERLSPTSSKRSVISYSVVGLDDSAVPVVAKAFPDRRHAALLDANLCTLSAANRGTAMAAPEALGLVREHRLVLYRPCEGVLLLDLVRSCVPGAVDGVRQAGRWLAWLHGSGAELPRRFSLAEEKRSTMRWASVIGRSFPELEFAAAGLARAWSSSVEASPSGATVPIHKDFHVGHVLIGSTVGVIDLDEARIGDPALDLANFCAHLEQVAPGRTWSDRLGRAFLAAYGDAGGRGSQRTGFRGYSAYAWLKIAKQAAAGTGPARGRPPAERRAMAATALAKGERWIAA